MTTSDSDTVVPTNMDDLSSSSSASNSLGSGYLHVQKGSRDRRLPKVFDFHSGRKCPTCAGTGKIPKGQEDELVALIPYSDKRLKPKKPWLAILLVSLIVFITVSIITGVVLGVLMYPREVTITVTNMTEIRSFVQYKKNHLNISNITLELSISVSITNKNYFPIQIDYISTELDYVAAIVSNHTEDNLTNVPSSSFKQYSYIQNATFPDAKGKRLLLLCTDKNVLGNIHLDITVSVAYTYLSHRSSIVETFSRYFLCSIKIPIHYETLLLPET